MLNKDNQRELAYIVTVDNVTAIEGYDRVELAHVGGWTIVVGKGQFESGSAAIYFEIDSKLPEVKPFIDMEFLVKKKFKIKTQKMCKSYSQGLLISPDEFGWTVQVEPLGGVRTEVVIDDEGKAHYPDDESRFLTEKLGVTYAVVEDNRRKAKIGNKYAKMAQRLGKKANTPWFKWLYQYNWGKKALFLVYGNKKADGTVAWPSHICSKTDVERIQNMPWILSDKTPYVATEKVDGSSMTVTAEKTRFGKIKQLVCSRNVVFATGKEQCFYDTNVYLEAYKKYQLEDKIVRILQDYGLDNVALQMEVYGGKIQKRDYSTNEHKIALFHVVSNKQKMPMDTVVEIAEKYDIPYVPVVCDEYIFPDTIEEVQAYVESEPSKIDGKPREGIVFYDKETGQRYTKFVSPEYLMKYH